MKHVKSSGRTRMKQLGKVKVEIWLTAAQAAALVKLAKLLYMPKGKLARRAVNYVVQGGEPAAYPLKSHRYD